MKHPAKKYYFKKGRPTTKLKRPALPHNAACCPECGSRMLYKDYLGRIVLYCPLYCEVAA